MSDNLFHTTNANSTDASAVHHNDFRSHVKEGWENVHPAIRARMDKLLTSKKAVTFKGYGCVKRSKMGWVFAHLAKILGSPLVWKEGKNVKITVQVAPTKNGLRCWHRLFQFEDGWEQLVQTTKVVDSKFGFLDAVGANGEKALATKMNVWAEGNSLYFTSTTYLLRFKFCTIHVPSIFTPGTLFAEHRDEGNGNFRYIFKFTHPLWGETFYQDGIFRLVN